jgi:hypothetical protein
MKVYLHGGRTGHTFSIKDVQFVDGVAEVDELSTYLERYYAVKPYPPEGHPDNNKGEEDGVQTEEGQEAEEVNDQSQDGYDELLKVVEEKKKELNKPKIKTMEDFDKFFEYKAYVKELTGITPKTKKQAEEVMEQYMAKGSD